MNNPVQDLGLVELSFALCNLAAFSLFIKCNSNKCNANKCSLRTLFVNIYLPAHLAKGQNVKQQMLTKYMKFQLIHIISLLSFNRLPTIMVNIMLFILEKYLVKIWNCLMPKH